MELAELGATIRETRLASGISQAQLAQMTGVSRATLNYTELGRSALGADALLRILAPLGLGISSGRRGSNGDSRQAVELLAASASVSFKETIPVSEVERAMLSGSCPDTWLPHIATIVDEASDATLLRAVRELAERQGTPSARIWRNIRRLASECASPHPRWA